MRRSKIMKNIINVRKMVVQEVEVDMGQVFRLGRDNNRDFRNPYIVTKTWNDGELVYVLASLKDGNIWTDAMPLDELAEYLQKNADILHLEYCGCGLEGVKEALK